MAILFTVDLEGGVLTGGANDFDAVSTDGGDMTCAAAAALAGTNFGASYLIDDTNAIYGSMTSLGSVTGVTRHRFWIDPNGLTMANGDEFIVLYLFNSTPSSFARVQLYYDSGYYINAGIKADTGVWNETADYAITDDQHCIEVLIVRATNGTSNDGYVSLWIDTTLKETKGSVDNYDQFFDFDEGRLGACLGLDAGTHDTFYMDEWVGRDDSTQIGCPLATTTTTTTTTQAPAEAVSAAVTCPRITYEIYLTNDAGLRLADSDGRSPLATFIELRASRVANGIGWVDVKVPRGSFNTNLFLKRDYGIQIWRAPRGGALSLWRHYFLRKWRFETTDGVRSLFLSGPCCNDLLRRRSVIAFAGSSEAKKSDYADDMMKEFVTEAESDSVEPTPDAGSRAWAQFSVAADLGAAPSINYSAPFDPLLTSSGGGVLPRIAKASRDAGTDLFFDVVASDVSAASIDFEFRTYINQPGQDLSDFVLFDEDRGNLGNAFYYYDASKEQNYAYGTGQMQGSARNVQQVYEADRYNASIWNRCEGVADARNEASDNGVREKARDLLVEGEPIERFGAVPKDTDTVKYGIHWNWGDRVKSRYEGMEFISIVNSIVLSVNKAGEQVITRLDYASDV